VSDVLNRKALRSAATKWLSKYEMNVFITVTLKKTIFYSHGALTHIDRVEAEKTAGFIRDRFLQALSRSASIDSKTLPFFVFFESGFVSWNPHLHIGAMIPPNMDFKDYSKLFCDTVGRLHWVNEQIDIRPITYCNDEDWQGICHYSLKTGLDAFLPEASNIP